MQKHWFSHFECFYKMAYALKTVHLFSTSSLSFCVIRDTHILKINWKSYTVEGHLGMQLSTTQLLTQPPPLPSGMGKKNQKGKSWKTHGLRWRQLGKQSGGKKPTKAQFTKQSITISWPICSQSSSNGTPMKHPPSILLMNMMLYSICL